MKLKSCQNDNPVNKVPIKKKNKAFRSMFLLFFVFNKSIYGFGFNLIIAKLCKTPIISKYIRCNA